MEKISGFILNPVTIKGDSVISVIQSLDNELPAEGYTLLVDVDSVRIQYADRASAFYALQSLSQLIFQGLSSSDLKTVLQQCEMRDYPGFVWRGMHLDVSRHFIPVESIKKYIDLLAQHKMNRFHWHLVDSQGWRMEVKQYPELTDQAAWRINNPLVDWSWRGEKGGIEAARQKHQVVMAPTTYTYLDYYQSTESYEPKAIGGHLPLKDVYSWEVVPKVLNDEESSYVLGGQAQLWTEFMNSYAQVEYMAYPRACAIAQKLWNSETAPSFSVFNAILQSHLNILSAENINFRFTGEAVKISKQKVDAKTKKFAFLFHLKWLEKRFSFI